MADRTSAGLFGEIFTMLAVDHPINKEKMVKYFWGMTRQFDFSYYQMDCDEALIKLGLARMGIDPDYPNEGEVMLYGPVKE